MCGGNSIDIGLENCTEQLAVILIDMQQNFVGGIDRRERQQMISKQISVIRWCAEKNIPVIVLEYRGEGKTIDVLSDELKKVANLTIIKKTHDDGFEKTDLADVLIKINAKKLFFMGINAGACVMSTVRSAINLGFETITNEEVIADSDEFDYMSWYEKNGVVLAARELQQVFS